jgi:hypothetical protein
MKDKPKISSKLRSPKLFRNLVVIYCFVHAYLALFVFNVSTHNTANNISTLEDKINAPYQLLHSSTRPDKNARVQVNYNSSLPDATLIIQMKGEMGNNLQKLAYGYGLSLWLSRKFGITPNLVVRHLPKKAKWTNARDDIHKCFPNLRKYDFEQGNHKEFKLRRTQQADWLQKYHANTSHFLQLVVQGESAEEIEKGLAYFHQLATSSQPEKPTIKDPKANITIPHLWIGNRPMSQLFIDNYIEEYRMFFRFDEDACCAQRPEPDESVFHFRQFATELQKLSLEEQFARGYQELSPNRTAHELFGHLQAGDKIAMTTRFHNDISRSYVSAFVERGLQVRVVTNQTGTQDFCFLLKARKELVGVATSTFVRWAGYLGDTSRVRLYSVALPNQTTTTTSRYHYPWNNSKLKSRLYFEQK